MPPTDVQLIEGVFDGAQNQKMTKRVRDALNSVEDENLLSVTWLRNIEVQNGQWGLRVNALTAVPVRRMAAGYAT